MRNLQTYMYRPKTPLESKATARCLFAKRMLDETEGGDGGSVTAMMAVQMARMAAHTAEDMEQMGNSAWFESPGTTRESSAPFKNKRSARE